MFALVLEPKHQYKDKGSSYAYYTFGWNKFEIFEIERSDHLH